MPTKTKKEIIMKIDTDNVCEIIAYGLTVNNMIDLADLADTDIDIAGHNACYYAKSRYGEWEEIRRTENFVERVVSLDDSDCELEDRLFEKNYIAYTCFSQKGKMEVTTDSDNRPIPQHIVDKIITFCLFYNLKYEMKKVS